jgi:hypothetical protein
MPDAINKERFEKIVLLLSSDQPGEVYAAAQAIGRQLPQAKLDWHQFAKLITSRLCHTPDPQATGYTETHKDHREERAAERPHGQFMADIEREMVNILWTRHRSQLKDNERDFISQQMVRISDYGAKTYITAKQRNWLHLIWERF